MEKINVKVNQTTREVGLTRQIVGNQFEDLQDELVFSFTDKFVDGQARLEYEIDNAKYWVTLDKVNETYTLPLNSQITSQEEVFMQLVISVDNGTFKSNVFSLYFANSINAETEAPEQYPTWLDKANEKLNQMDNINITANKVDNVATITVTRKDKTKDTVKIEDGTKGDRGDKGDIGATGNGISSIEKVDSVGLKTNYKINFTDGTNFNYSVNDGKTPVKGTDYFTEQDKQEMVNGIVTDANSDFNVNVEAKTNEFNSNAKTKTNTFNSNASSKVGEYNTNAKKELNSYNDNATAKLKAYNDNHTTKLEEYNNNSIVKTGNYNDNADKQVADFNTNVINKTIDFNKNADDKLNEIATKNSIDYICLYGVDAEVIKDILKNEDTYKGKKIIFRTTDTSQPIGFGYIVFNENDVSLELLYIDVKGNVLVGKADGNIFNNYYNKKEIDMMMAGSGNFVFEEMNDFSQPNIKLLIEKIENAIAKHNYTYTEKTIQLVTSTGASYAFFNLVNNNVELIVITSSGVERWTKTTREVNYTKQQIDDIKNNLDDEVNNLTAEVSDNSEKIGLINRDQKLQNDRIQENTNANVRQDKNIASNSKRLKTLETNIFDSGVASGENINIKDSALAEFQEIKSSINKAQETTKGDNLFNKLNVITNENLGEVQQIEKGFKLTRKVPSNYGDLFMAFCTIENLEKNVNYTFYTERKVSKGNADLYIYSDILSGTQISKNVSVSGDKICFQFSTTDTGKIVLGFYSINQTTDDYQEYTNSMLVKGTFDTNNMPPYEPYTGGIASPNPDYPQEINTIKENWETVSCGKNVFNIEKYFKDVKVRYTKNGNLYTCEKIGSGYQITYPISEKDTEITLQGIVKNITATNFRIEILGENNNVKGQINDSISKVTANGNRIRLNVTANGTYSIESPMINLGKEQPYEPYQAISTPNDLKGNEFLPGDNIIKKFNVEDGKYWAYLEKNMNTIIYNGNEDWGVEDYGYGPSFYNLSNIANAKGPNTCMCNYFISHRSGAYADENIFISATKKVNILPMSRQDIITIENWKNWLKEKSTSGKPIEIVYELADEYKRLIPIAPLDQMNMTYNPETNLFSSIDNIKIEAKYYREFATTIRNMQIDNGKLQEQLNDMEKRIVALENKPVEVIEPVEESVVNA